MSAYFFLARFDTIFDGTYFLFRKIISATGHDF